MCQKSLVDDMMVMMNTVVERLVDFSMHQEPKRKTQIVVFFEAKTRFTAFIRPFPLAFAT